MDTIYALSSGALPAGLAVIRVSGPNAGQVLERMTGSVPLPGRLCLREIRDPLSELLLDRGLVLWNRAPKSFTGEDACELHVHGSRAVASAVFDSLTRQGLRIAEPGEFTRRAFDAGKLDLTEVEGLADLISAETEMQRRQAVSHAGGFLRDAAASWRSELIRLRSDLEARLDFSDEGDVSTELPKDHALRLRQLCESMRDALAHGDHAEQVREGFRVVIAGRPNAGKSSLLNALIRRDMAIVTEEPGTTRDVLEARLDLNGYAIRLYDTAGLREAQSAAEQEGVRRTFAAMGEADLVLWLSDGSVAEGDIPMDRDPSPVKVLSKVDLLPSRPDGLAVSSYSGEGLPELLAFIGSAAAQQGSPAPALLTRQRHRTEVSDALLALEQIPGTPDEIAAHLLQSAGEAIGRLTGRIDVDEVLDNLFGEFCIGK